MSRGLLHYASIASLIGLIFLALSWERWLAPLRPGGSWLALKALPLLLPLFGILRGRRYAYQWALVLVLAYAVEGLVRAWTETGLSAGAGMERGGHGHPVRPQCRWLHPKLSVNILYYQ